MISFKRILRAINDMTHFNLQTPSTHTQISIGAILVYMPMFLLAYPLLMGGVTVLAALPVFVIAWLWGWRIGLLVGILSWPLNILLYSLFGQPGLDSAFQIGSMLAQTLVALVGVVAGQLRRADTQPQEIVTSVDDDEERSLVIQNNDEQELQDQILAKELVEKLDQSEAHYHLLAELSQRAMLIHVDRKIVAANSAGVELLGATSIDELIGRSMLDFIPTDWETIKNSVQKGFQNDEEQFEPAVEKMTRLDGKLVEVEVSATPIIFHGEGATQVILSHTSERRESQDVVRESCIRFEDNFTKALVGMALLDAAEGRFLQVSRSFHMMLGYSEEELLDTTLQQITHPKDSKISQALLRQMKDGELSSYRVENRYQHRLGHTLWVHLNISLVHDARGDPLYFLAQFEDITRRKEAEETLKRNEQRYRAIVEQSTDCIFLLDAKTRRVLDANPAMCRLLGYTHAELLRLNAYDLIPDEYANVDTDILRAHAELTDGIREQRYKRKDGSAVEMEVCVSLIRYDDHQALCMVARDLNSHQQVDPEPIYDDKQHANLSASS